MGKRKKDFIKRMAVCCFCLLTAFFIFGGMVLEARAAEVGAEGIPEGNIPEGGAVDGLPPEGDVPEGGGLEGMPQQAAGPDGEGNAPVRGVGSANATSVQETAWQGGLRVLSRSRVRREADIRSNVAGSLDADTIVRGTGKVLDENGELWFHIQVEEPAIEGYIKADLVEETDGFLEEENEGENPEGGPEESIGTQERIVVKSNFALAGNNHLTAQAQEVVQTVTEPGVDYGQEKGTGTVLAKIRTGMDKGLVVLAVITVGAAGLLYYSYGRLMAGMSGDVWGLNGKDKRTPKRRKPKKKKADVMRPKKKF